MVIYIYMVFAMVFTMVLDGFTMFFLKGFYRCL